MSFAMLGRRGTLHFSGMPPCVVREERENRSLWDWERRYRQHCPPHGTRGRSWAPFPRHVGPSSTALLRADAAPPGCGEGQHRVKDAVCHHGGATGLPRAMAPVAPLALLAVGRALREPPRCPLQPRFLFRCGSSETAAACLVTLPAEWKLRLLDHLAGKSTKEADLEHQESRGERERQHGTGSVTWRTSKRNPRRTRLTLPRREGNSRERDERCEGEAEQTVSLKSTFKRLLTKKKMKRTVTNNNKHYGHFKLLQFF